MELKVIPITRLKEVPLPVPAEYYCLWFDDDERVVVLIYDEPLEKAA
jgi:hypothetical protein